MSIVQIKNREEFVNRIKESGGYTHVITKVKCSQTMLCLIAKGERNPSPVLAINICSATGRKFDSIFL